MLSKEMVAKFKDIVKRKYGFELSDEEASNLSNSIIQNLKSSLDEITLSMTPKQRAELLSLEDDIEKAKLYSRLQKFKRSKTT